MRQAAIKLQIPNQVLEKLNALFLSWKVRPRDWTLATEPALQRQGYAIYDEKNPYEIDLWVNAKKMPWKVETGWTTIPPKNSRYLRELEKFVKTSGYSVHMVPTPFGGFTVKKMSKTVDYPLAGGASIKLVTPATYVEQLTSLLTHKTTQKAFRVRAGKFAERASLLLSQAKQRKDYKTAKACEKFLKLAGRIGRQKISVTASADSSPVQTTVLKGFGVGKKKVRGRARLILHARDFGKMKQGEILVTFDTNPEYLLILRKMKAIVTDNGGITCHAAIIAREFNVPAVVGTKYASKVLKDGMVIEVDAKLGLVKVIK